MPLVWFQNNDNVQWSSLCLENRAVRLEATSGGVSAAPVTQVMEAKCAMLVPQAHGSVQQWLLVAPDSASAGTNGEPLRLGARVLRDRDEISVCDPHARLRRRCYFSTERLAAVMAYPPGMPTARCPRCKQPIEHGHMAVQCPSAACGAWHHQTEEFPCWTYHNTCALCDQQTSLDAGYRWTPEQL